MLGYNLLELYYPYDLGNCEIYGPQLSEKKSILLSGLGEAVLTFSFMLVVLNVIKYVKNVNIARPIYAVALRILLTIKVFYSAGSGNFNPMTGAYLLVHTLSHTLTHLLTHDSNRLLSLQQQNIKLVDILLISRQFSLLF